MSSFVTSPSRSVPSYRITGLAAAPFRSLFALTDAELVAHGARRCTVDSKPGFPDRVALRDAEVGETVLLVNHTHLPDAGPYTASHAIYVAEGSTDRFDALDRVPDALRTRLLSVRAFDRDRMMIDAEVVDGRDVEPVIERFLAAPATDFLHLHFARRGCYAARVDRAGRDAH